jgi:hypothetical protein
MKRNSPWKIVGILLALVVLIGTLVAMNRMSDNASAGVTTGVEHDHDGDGKPDH